MAAFNVEFLADSCSYGMFPSTSQHVAESCHGKFYSYLSSQDSVNYAAQTLKIVWAKPDGTMVELPSSTGAPRVLASQSAAVETFWDTGELFAVWSDYINGGLYIERWPDVSMSLTPMRTVITGAGTACGKFTTCADEGARCIYFIGTAGYFFRINDDGTLGYRQQLLLPDTGPSYFVLTQDEDGKLYLVWCTGLIANGITNYSSIMCLMSMNAHEAPPTGAVWFPGTWTPGTSIQAPIVADNNGPAVYALTGAQSRSMNNLLVAAQIVDGKRLCIAYAQGPRSGSRMFYADNLKECTVGFTALQWSNVDALQNAKTTVKRPLRTRSTMPRCASGGIYERESGLYFVGHDNAFNLICLRSTDGGENWKDYAKTQMPAFPVSSRMLHYVSGYRGWDDDTEIHGAVSVIQAYPHEWSSGTGIPSFPTYLYKWSLNLA